MPTALRPPGSSDPSGGHVGPGGSTPGRVPGLSGDAAAPGTGEGGGALAGALAAGRLVVHNELQARLGRMALCTGMAPATAPGPPAAPGAVRTRCEHEEDALAANVTLTEDMKRVVGEQRLGFVATVCPDGTPNLSPKGTTAVLDDEHLVFADIRSPNTVRNLRANPAIEVNVVDPIARKGYRFKGRGEVVTDGPRFERIMAAFERQLSQQHSRVRAFVVVAVERALPLTSPAYDLGASEREVRERWERHYDALRGKHREDGAGPAPSEVSAARDG